MATYRVRPSKQMAVFGAVFGLGILIFGVVTMTRSDSDSGWFMWLWLTAGVAIIAFNLWAAFGKKGHLQTIESDDDTPPPTGFGQTTQRS